MSRKRDEPSLVDKVERSEARATRDFLAGDYGPPMSACRIESAIPSSAKVVAYDLLNAESPVGEAALFALVDAAVSVLVHEGREETARLAFETVVEPRVALEAVRTLIGGR